MYDVHVEPPNMQRELTRQHPLIFFLHGAGERGIEERSWREQVTYHGPWRKHGCPSYEKGSETVREVERFFVAAPHLSDKQSDWDPELLREAFEQLRDPESVTGRQIDPQRCYLTGVSLGGRGAVRFALAYPDLFAAVAPVCPAGTRSLAPEVKSLGQLPIWLFHGSLDGRDLAGEVIAEALLPQNSLSLYQALDSPRNGLSIIPEVGHNVWVHAYDTPALYRWFLGHRRGR